jgi:membrane-bound ClpP family serine protease
MNNTTKFIVGAVISLLVLMAAVVGLVFALSANPGRTANLRDIIFIVLAFVTLLINLVTGLLIALLIYRVQGLVVTVQTEVTPMLARASQTVNAVRNTTLLVNENIARPAIRVAGFLAGLRRGGTVAGSKVSSGKAAKSKASKRI